MAALAAQVTKWLRAPPAAVVVAVDAPPGLWWRATQVASRCVWVLNQSANQSGSCTKGLLRYQGQAQQHRRMNHQQQ
jgi:hypothetical protein